MRKFIKNSIYFSLPFLIWAIFVFIIDPFNYFNKIHLVDNNAKVNAENLKIPHASTLTQVADEM